MAVAELENLLEVTDTVGPVKIDREASVIRGVKVLGLKSANGREYTPEAVSRARGLYESKQVNINHRDPNARGSRDLRDRFGVLRNIVVADDGLRGDLHFNPKHALAEQVIYDAENSPNSLGLSHDAEGRTARRGGKTIVEEIVNVRSVDLVGDPATTRSLFESRGTGMSDANTPKTVTIKSVLESVYKGQSDKLTILREMDAAMAGTMDAPAETASVEDQAAAAFEAMVVAVVRDKSLDKAGKLAKIREIFSAEEKLSGKGKESSGGESEGGDKKEPTTEARIAKLEAENEVYRLLESEQRTASDVQVEAAIGLTDAAKRKAFIQSLPKRGATSNGNGHGNPRSSEPFTESRGNGNGAKAPELKTPAEKVAYLRGR